MHSIKTEHHVGKGTRVVPVFPELVKPLTEVFEQAEPGSQFVITRYRSSEVNLRTQLGRIASKAGLPLWSKPWQNCRSSRETELAEEYPIEVVCEWIGNSPAVASRHYLQVTDAHFARAVGGHKGALQKAVQQALAEGRTGPQGGTETCQIAGKNEALRDPANGGARLAGFEPATYGLGNRRSIP